MKYFSDTVETLFFSSGTGALEYIIENKTAPRLIFLNLYLPKNETFNFLEIFEKLEIEKQQTEIYILSTMVLKSDLEKLKRHSNYVGCVEKPLTVEKRS